MALRPTWSTGCHACRKMKVKCDEGKPECGRCKRSGRICPGYRETGEMRFRSMNSWAAGQSSRPPGSATASSSSTLQRAQPSTSWEQYAIARFIDNFVVSPSNGALGYMECLPEMLNRGSECLQEAMLASATANLANISCMHQLDLKSRQHYGKALRSLRATMNDLSTATTDDTLTAIMLLQKYEIISGMKQISGGPHEAAITEMLRLRGVEQPASQGWESLSRIIQLRRQVQALGGDDVPVSTERISKMTPLGHSFLPLLRDASIASSPLHDAMARVSNGCSPSEAASDEILQHAVMTYFRLLSWPRLVPENRKYRILEMPIEGDIDKHSDYAPKQFYLFTDVLHGAVWIAYWCGCMHLSQSLIQSFSLFTATSHVRPDAKLSISEAGLWEGLLTTVDDICSSAPFLLGDLDGQGQLNIGGKSKALGAFFLLRGLFVANTIENLPLGQRRLILDHLGRIGTAVGIKMALKQRDRWLASHPIEAEKIYNMSGK